MGQRIYYFGLFGKHNFDWDAAHSVLAVNNKLDAIFLA